MVRYLRLIIAFLLCSVCLNGQKQVSGLLLDSATNQPVQFANIVFLGTQSGTISDINGWFQINMSETRDSILVSCLGYFSKIFNVRGLEGDSVIRLVPSPIALSEVEVVPGQNPAIGIVNRVIEHAKANNPDEAVNYKCVVYHRMSFHFDIPDAIHSNSPSDKRMRDFNQRNHLLLLESVSEKSHIKPDLTSEKQITGRVSGMKDPALAFITSQIQPFVFYNKYIRLLDVSYLNPVSRAGLDCYFFNIEDTLTSLNGDTLLYLSFRPRKNVNIQGLEGTLHIHLPTFAIKTVTADASMDDTPFSLYIRQNYSYVDQRQWFPEQLESRLVIRNIAAGKSLPYPLVGEGKSFVTQVILDPDLKKSDFGAVQFEDMASSANVGDIEKMRYSPLTDKDSMTYLLIDSLGRKAHLDRLLRFQKYLITGFIPVGPFKLEYNKLIDYSDFEGLKLGLGLWTGESFSEKWSTGGYFVRSLKRKDNKQGAALIVNLSKKSDAKIELNWKDDFIDIGSISFLDGYKKYSAESFRKYLVENMDRASLYSATVQTRFARYFKGALFYKYLDATPLLPYRFYLNPSTIQSPYSYSETGIKLRWAPKETYSLSSFGLMANASGKPVVWLNVSLGQDFYLNKFHYVKSEFQIQQTFQLTPQSSTVIRLNGGYLKGDFPSSLLYSDFGSYKAVGLEIPYSFSTMRLNEFAADRFTCFYFRHSIPLRLNKPGKFKPEVSFITNGGYGTIGNYSKAGICSSFEKGYYESGVVLDRLFSQLLINYGFSIHYRYGFYQLDSAIDNWAFKVAVKFNLQ